MQRHQPPRPILANIQGCIWETSGNSAPAIHLLQIEMAGQECHFAVVELERGMFDRQCVVAGLPRREQPQPLIFVETANTLGSVLSF